MPHTPDHKDNLITSNTAGVSNTNVNSLTQGGLANLTSPSILAQAQTLADTVMPTTKTEPDLGMASLLYFSKLAEESSKPGATLLGAAGSAFQSPAAYLMKQKQLDDANKKAKATMVASLVPTLAKAQKTSKEEPYVSVDNPTTDSLVYYSKEDFAKLPKDQKTKLIPYKQQKVEASKLYVNTSDNTIKVGDEDVLPDGKIRLTNTQLGNLDSNIGSVLGEFKATQPSLQERNRDKLISFGNNYDNLKPKEKQEYSIIYQELVKGKPIKVIENGVEVTKFEGGIDLRLLKNLPVPEGFDVEKVLNKQKRSYPAGTADSAGYAVRLFQNDGVIRTLTEDKGYRPNIADMVKQHAGILKGTGNFLQTTEAQKFYQASANFVAALLRKESGAAIAESEYRDAYKQYFPQLGDSAETILTKQNAREAVIRNMVGAAGDALTDFHPAVQKYLQTEIEGKKYDSFDTKGYVKYLDKKIMDTKGQLFRLKIQGKTLDQLKNMLADPKANEKLANYQILIIDELIDAKLTSED